MIQIVYVSEVELTGIEISFYAGSEEEKWAALTLRIKGSASPPPWLRNFSSGLTYDENEFCYPGSHGRQIASAI